MNDFGSETDAARGRKGMASKGPVVKVCGITCLEDALASVELGANALGFNFYPRSSRFITPAKATEILEELPATLTVVGVVVVDPRDDPRLESEPQKPRPEAVSRSRIGSETGPPLSFLPSRIDWIQIHGVRSKADLPAVERELLIAASPGQVSEFPDHKVIIDTSWGTGRLADWTALKNLGREYILSGGLSPENVREALKSLEPWGVDVCSGVEGAPGRKDLHRLARFLDLAWGHYDARRPSAS